MDNIPQLSFAAENISSLKEALEGCEERKRAKSDETLTFLVFRRGIAITHNSQHGDVYTKVLINKNYFTKWFDENGKI